MRVAETFEITGRGLVVAVTETTDMPIGRMLAATIISPDGTTTKVDAFKEWLLRRTHESVDGEAFLLVGLSKADVPIGSEVHLTIPT